VNTLPYESSYAQAIAWRIFAATNTLFAAIVLTKGKAGAASKIAGTDSVVKTLLFYFYERLWVRVAPRITAKTPVSTSHCVVSKTPDMVAGRHLMGQGYHSRGARH
jgi:uncharacterized membrane protein